MARASPAYDGGNIFVESLTGNVNAGTGGSGSVLVTKPYLNTQGQEEFLNDVIPGSGILATSYPQLVYGQTSGQVGNITVETPQGNIIANQGGIAQLALGPVSHNTATIDLDRGQQEQRRIGRLRGQCGCLRLRRHWRPSQYFGHGEYQSA